MRMAERQRTEAGVSRAILGRASCGKTGAVIARRHPGRASSRTAKLRRRMQHVLAAWIRERHRRKLGWATNVNKTPERKFEVYAAHVRQPAVLKEQLDDAPPPKRGSSIVQHKSDSSQNSQGNTDI